jgi:hypothetical protein
MLCDICRNGLEGMWDPTKTLRLGVYAEWFPPKKKSSGNPTPRTEAEDSRLDAERYVFAHHKTLDSFQQSQGLGCVQCNRFMGFESELPPYPLNDGKRIPQAEEAGYFSVFHVILRRGDPIMFIRHGDSMGGFEMVPVGEEKYDTNVTFEMEPFTDSPKTWAIVDRWIQDCLENHEHCNEHSQLGYLPTRLLAIDPNTMPQTFKLVSKSECAPGSRYTTLSHCWGTKKPVEEKLCLLKSTFDDLCKDHPIHILPKTFRDAISVALRYNIQYIWIDSLCIYQDNTDDWRAEASTMQDVYQSSSLNISALGAADDDSGCFFERDPARVTPTIVQLQRSADSAPEPFRFQLEKAWAWRLSLSREPILERAWVVQERLLPPRVVHFGRLQVFWECREQNACEIHPETVYCFSDDREGPETRRGREAERKHRPHLWKQLLNAPDRLPALNAYDQLFVDWNAIMYIYTDCALTVPSDKLVALSGLAAAMKSALERLNPGTHRYIAGLWEEQLIDQICWFIRGRGKRSEYRCAPSWSWASVNGRTWIDGPARSEEKEKISFVTHCTAEAQNLGPNDTSQVSGGTLTLSGPWTKVQFGELLELGHANNTPRRLSHFMHPQTAETYEVEAGSLSTGQSLSSALAMFDVCDEMPDEAFCVLIQAKPWAEESYTLQGIVLLRVSDATEELYRRVGVLTATWSSKAKVASFVNMFPNETVRVV